MENRLLEAGTWERIEVRDGVAPPAAPPTVWGINASGSALVAAAGYWPETGRLEALAAFPSMPGLREFSQRDGVGNLYMGMAVRGELVTIGARLVHLPNFLQAVMRRFGRPAIVAVDQWRADLFLESIAAAGIPSAHLDLRSTDLEKGSSDIKAFREACEMGKVRPLRSLLMTAAMRDTKVTTDADGNENIETESWEDEGARVTTDVAVAAVMAVAAGRGGVPAARMRFFFGPA